MGVREKVVPAAVAPEGFQAHQGFIAGAWSEGIVYNTPESFKEYVKKTALEYNQPVKVSFGEIELK